MRRFLTIPLLFIYIIAVSGVKIELHYCGHNLESWNMFTKSDGCSDDKCTDEADDDGCCKNEVVIAKVVNDQNSAQQLVVKLTPVIQSAVLHDYPELSQPILYGEADHVAYTPNAPPGLWQDIPLYKLHSNLTYYG